ncbi:high frequency lysogenization protein HflD [Dokdonella sp.]|uniref:high frequency lysogenization protein HflD n=1 Tax=Dokdonella sp. TaxID=2291710 RepID=UPI002631259F|nr:high frequency lysogenization protein HflD [Dokdonella sp.]
MREARVIALAGVLQACRLVRDIATTGRTDATSARSSLDSVFRFDADSAADVFGGLGGVRLGLETLLDQFENDRRDLTLTQLVVGVLRLERKLANRPAMLRELRSGIESIQRQVDHLGVAHASVQARLAELYVATLSQLRPRVVVHGNPLQLSDAQKVEQIRALLLAGVRAAVLWRQVGGSQLRLLFRRREYAMLARGLLTRSTLDSG